MCNSLKKVKVGVLSGTLYIKECDLLNNIQVEKGSNDAGLELRTLYNLKELTIPDPITHTIFSDLPALEKLTIPANYKGLTADEINGHMKTARLKEIGEKAFENCKSLVEVEIPDGVTSIGNYAFADCSGLTSINIPDSVTSIGKGVFYGCSNLTNITIPESVTSIGEGAFCECNSLTSIYIPKSVTSIDRGAFAQCYSLTIYCEVASKPSGWSSMWNRDYWNPSTTVVWGYKK